MTQSDQDYDQNRDEEWREPPGYLGEAVRRAKLIPRRVRRAEPSQERTVH